MSLHEPRQASAEAILQSRNLDAILFTGLENIRYLCGCRGSDVALGLTPRESFFLCDSRYWTQAEEEVKTSRIVHYRKKTDGIASLLLEFDLKHIGFESGALTYSFYQSLKEKLGDHGELIPLDEDIKPLRIVKDAHELSLMKTAIEISTKAFRHILDLLREGAVESEIAFEMECFMKKKGSDAVAFDTIIASGKRSALPHGKASPKRIEKGDLILIDFGCRFQGYHSDETCTAVLGQPSPEQKKTHQVVKDAHDKAIEGVRPGITISEVDGIARNYIRDCGFGDYFGHGLGHGVGLAVHEEPGVNGENKGVVEEGMVFTIEPGIYIPDRGGVRLEDMVLVTHDGAEVLTSLPKELIVL
ncbi:MAG: aminopeptidase P family protein [Deltaproteobacteria bacterium]|nr:MAG: aminopeptidase P family protein [Deltaproteobacteria bacterium]